MRSRWRTHTAALAYACGCVCLYVRLRFRRHFVAFPFHFRFLRARVLLNKVKRTASRTFFRKFFYVATCCISVYLHIHYKKLSKKSVRCLAVSEKVCTFALAFRKGRPLRGAVTVREATFYEIIWIGTT